jgi:hypothetical protein
MESYTRKKQGPKNLAKKLCHGICHSFECKSHYRGIPTDLRGCQSFDNTSKSSEEAAYEFNQLLPAARKKGRREDHKMVIVTSQRTCVYCSYLAAKAKLEGTATEAPSKGH